MSDVTKPEPLTDEWFLDRSREADCNPGGTVREVAAAALEWMWQRCVRVANCADADRNATARTAADVLAQVAEEKMKEVRGG